MIPQLIGRECMRLHRESAYYIFYSDWTLPMYIHTDRKAILNNNAGVSLVISGAVTLRRSPTQIDFNFAR